MTTIDEVAAPACNLPVRRDPEGLELDVEGLCTHYGEAQVLKDVALRVYRGEVVALLGSNGAGKTTLLRALTGLLKPSRGSIVFHG
jgi:branched-chain amino acid transport system ATP-binding protein